MFLIAFLIKIILALCFIGMIAIILDLFVDFFL